MSTMYMFILAYYPSGGYDSDPCSNYRKLSSADRAAGFRKLTRKSDKRGSWKEDWYRFAGDAGDMIASM